MATHKLQERIESLEERLRQLKAQNVRANARQRSRDTRRNRRDDTRRKILVGAIVLAKVEQGVMEEATLLGWLDSALTREDDRALFELSVRPAAATVDTKDAGPVT